MSGQILLDTCTISHYFGKEAKERTPNLVRRVAGILDAGPPHLSVVTLYEINRWLQKLLMEGKGASKARIFGMFFSTATVYQMSPEIWGLAAHVHATAAMRNITFSEADLFILATALAHGLLLLTADQGLVNNAQTLGLVNHVEALALA